MCATWTVRTVRTAGAAAAAAALALSAGCAGQDRPARAGGNGPSASASERSQRIPGVGGALSTRVPPDSRQVLAVYGKSARSAESTAVLYTRRAGGRQRERSWAAHNGRHGWTTAHHEGDGKSPVGVFTLSDAGGVLPDPLLRSLDPARHPVVVMGDRDALAG